VDKGTKITYNDTEIQSIATQISDNMLLTEYASLKGIWGKEEYVKMLY
jgi:hypothetical protein